MPGVSEALRAQARLFQALTATGRNVLPVEPGSVIDEPAESSDQWQRAGDMFMTDETPGIPDSFSVDVRVTDQDISAGHRFDAFRCPVGLALTRALVKEFPDEPLGSVRGSVSGLQLVAHFYGGVMCDTWSLPSGVKDFIEGYDAGPGPVKPFGFTATFNRFSHW